jgi:hypothetical protein
MSITRPRRNRSQGKPQGKPRRRSRRRDNTPICSYIDVGQESQIGSNGLLRIEPSRKQRPDVTPAYVFCPGELEPRLHEQQVSFGDWLVQRGLVSRPQLFVALHRSRTSCCRVGDALVELKVLARKKVEAEARAFDKFLELRKASAD